MIIKTEDLLGLPLVFAVATALGIPLDTRYTVNFKWKHTGEYNCGIGRTDKTGNIDGPAIFAPLCWSVAGELLQNHLYWLEEQGDSWAASGKGGVPQYNECPLVAICRAVVSRYYGEEIEIPNELIKGENNDY